MKLKRTYALFQWFSAKFNDISLKYKLMIFYGSLMAFSIFLVGWFSNYNMNKYVSRQTSDSYGQTLRQVKMNVEFKMQTYDRLLKQIGSDKALISVLSNGYALESDYIYDYLKTISKVFEQKETDENILDIFVFKNNRTIAEDGHNLFDIEKIKDEAWFKKTFSGMDGFNINDLIRVTNMKIWIVSDDEVKTGYYSGKGEPLSKVVIIRPIIKKFEQIVGFIEVYIRSDAIFGSLLEDEDIEAKHIFIANEDGEIIFDNTNPSYEKTKVSGKYIENTSGKAQGRVILNDGSHSQMVLFVKGQDSKWTYFMELPMKDLLDSVKSMKEFTVIIILLSIIVSSFMGVVIASMISKRVATLSKKMEHVEDLNLHLLDDIGGNDEIGRLARSYNIMLCKITRLVEELKASHQRQKETEILALQAQINPHFLYNTLATINWMALDNNNAKIIKMVKYLAIFYRLSLNKGKEYIEVLEEINQVKAYVNIQKIRMEEKINVFYDISEDIAGLYTPKIILQPFVENAILHGAEYKNGTTNIHIKVKRLEDGILFEIIDDGVGMRNVPDPDKYPDSSGYGIRNVHEKITIQYGSGYGVKIFSLLGAGTKASIRLPIIDASPGG